MEAFAHDQELSVVEASAPRRSVIVRGTVAQVEAAFGVRLGLYELGGRTFRGRSGPVLLPAGLIGVVEGVFGLDDRPQAGTRFRLAAPVGAQNVAFPEQAGVGFSPHRFPRVQSPGHGLRGHPAQPLGSGWTVRTW